VDRFEAGKLEEAEFASLRGMKGAVKQESGGGGEGKATTMGQATQRTSERGAQTGCFMVWLRSRMAACRGGTSTSSRRSGTCFHTMVHTTRRCDDIQHEGWAKPPLHTPTHCLTPLVPCFSRVAHHATPRRTPTHLDGRGPRA